MKKTPWARRIISTTVLLIMVLAVGFLIFRGVQGVIGLATAQSASQSGTSKSGVTPVAIPPCQLSDLTIDTQTDPASPVGGEATKLTLDLTHKGKVACSVLAGALDVQLLTGDDTVWTPLACNEDWSKDLLLGPGDTWQGSVNWDGKRYNSCEPALTGEDGEHRVAEPGTYRLKVLLDGKAADQENIIVVQ